MKNNTSKRLRSRNNKPFMCIQCGYYVEVDSAGSHRNHCPRCLWSRHVDIHPGDRAAECDGMMEPIAISARKGGEWSIVHRCRRCGSLDINRISAEDNELVLMSIAVRPLGQTPFPIHLIEGV